MKVGFLRFRVESVEDWRLPSNELIEREKRRFM